MYPQTFHQAAQQASETIASQYLCFDHNANQDGWVDLNVLPEGVSSLRESILFPEGPLKYNQPRPDSSSNAFCLSCHSDDGSDVRPASLLIDALIIRPLILQDDDRRQPMQPPAKIFGHIPAHSFADLPATDITADQGRDSDEFIHP